MWVDGTKQHNTMFRSVALDTLSEGKEGNITDDYDDDSI